MKVAIYPGSFDPITKGHIDIIERSSLIFDKVIVVIMKNDKKICLFSESERLEMIEEACIKFDNVSCKVGSGLSVKYAQEQGACAMIRGIRAIQDYEYELASATANMYLNKAVETVFFMSKPEYSFLSSSSAKEIARYQGDVSGFVESFVEEKLKRKMTEDK